MVRSFFVSTFVAGSLAFGSLTHAAEITVGATGGLIPDSTGVDPGRGFYDFERYNVSGEVVAGVGTVTLTGLTHTYVSDLYAHLAFFPDDPEEGVTLAVLFGNVNDGVNASSGNLGGNYSFSNSATGTLQANAQPIDDNATIPPGLYLPSEVYLHGINPPLVVDLSERFAGIDPSTGVFSIYIEDNAGGDTGALASAKLTYTTVPEPTAAAALIAVAGLAVSRRRKPNTHTA